MTVDRTGQTVGSHTCTITVSSNGGSVTIAVTTSQQFTDVLEANFYLSGPEGDEGNLANNRTWPVRVGSRPFEKIYLPLVLR